MALVKVSVSVMVDTNDYADAGDAADLRVWAATMVSEDHLRGIKREVFDVAVDGAEFVGVAYYESWKSAKVVVAGTVILPPDAE